MLVKPISAPPARAGVRAARFGGPGALDDVDQGVSTMTLAASAASAPMTWTGSTATALRLALRMTQEEIAAQLQVGRRTVAEWRARPDRPLSLVVQRDLDTVYTRADDATRARFRRLVDSSVPDGVVEPVASGGDPVAEVARLQAQMASLADQVGLLVKVMAEFAEVVAGTSGARR